MKISININPDNPETEISLTCPSLTPEVEKLISMIRVMDSKLTVKKDGEVFLLDLGEILYLETMERKCFVYTDKTVYETDAKMYELEQQLAASGFFRVSKSTLLQLKHIKSLRADLNHRIRITMDNGEQLIASRMYADDLRERLGLR
ncbi:MAG: LytTR family transcriptional regulator DNA-binding domain-containing protein [Clostridiales bacterium]|nr:LytTR family transcriptional regulator DNA-binding domain-containing protein [Clostridiales bacterium]MBR5936739.1 LytTR family transcriptional regulator DNA-binding domain-containing protein [Clostridiales bacterium]